MVSERFPKILAVILALFILVIGVGSGAFFLLRKGPGERDTSSVQEESGFPQAGQRELAPYQYPQGREGSSPPEKIVTPQSTSPASPPLISPPSGRKPSSSSPAPSQKFIYPSDFQPYGDAGEEGYNPAADNEIETE